MIKIVQIYSECILEESVFRYFSHLVDVVIW